MPVKNSRPRTASGHIKHWLWPHKHNDHRPNLIRAHGLLVLAAIVIGIQLAANVLKPVDTKVLAYAVDITSVGLLTQTNQQRAANGLPALRLDSRLNASAKLKLDNMFAENYWAHNSPSGLEPWYWFKQVGYPYAYAGENLAKDFATTSGTIDGWMNSAGHRANILNGNYTDVGFAVANGTLLGGQTTLVVAHYGKEISPANQSLGAKSVIAPTATPKVAVTLATPVPVVTAQPTPVLTVAPVIAVSSPTSAAVADQSSAGAREVAPASQQYSLFRPLTLTRTLNWATLVTVGLLSLLLLVYTLTHLTVWNKGLKRWQKRRYRGLAALQIGGLIMLLAIIVMSGFGSVG